VTPPPGEPALDPSAGRVQVDKVCPAAREDAKRVAKLQAAERRAQWLRVTDATVVEAQSIASRRWDADEDRWIAETYRRAHGKEQQSGAPAAQAAALPDILSPSLCRAVARRAPRRCAELPQGDRAMCEVLAQGFRFQGGVEVCPSSGPMAGPCRFLKTHDLGAVRGTPLEVPASQYLAAARSLDTLCDRARRGAESAVDGAPTCIVTSLFSAVRDGVAACPSPRPGDHRGFGALITQCRAMVQGDASACDRVSPKERLSVPAPPPFFVAARVFGSSRGPTLSAFLVAPTRLACVLEFEVDTWEGPPRRVTVSGTTSRVPADGDFLPRTPLPPDVRPGRDARLVSKTCVPWAF